MNCRWMAKCLNAIHLGQSLHPKLAVCYGTGCYLSKCAYWYIYAPFLFLGNRMALMTLAQQSQTKTIWKSIVHLPYVAVLHPGEYCQCSYLCMHQHCWWLFMSFIQTNCRTILLTNVWKTLRKATQILEYIKQEDQVLNAHRPADRHKFSEQISRTIRNADASGTYSIYHHIQSDILKSEIVDNPSEYSLTDFEFRSLKFVSSQRQSHRKATTLRSEQRTLNFLNMLHRYLRRLKRVLAVPNSVSFVRKDWSAKCEILQQLYVNRLPVSLSFCCSSGSLCWPRMSTVFFKQIYWYIVYDDDDDEMYATVHSKLINVQQFCRCRLQIKIRLLL
jgi:hypothetical protein